MNFAFLLLTSAIPVFKVCLLSLVGVALAHLVSPIQPLPPVSNRNYAHALHLSVFAVPKHCRCLYTAG